MFYERCVHWLGNGQYTLPLFNEPTEQIVLNDVGFDLYVYILYTFLHLELRDGCFSIDFSKTSGYYVYVIFIVILEYGCKISKASC